MSNFIIFLSPQISGAEGIVKLLQLIEAKSNFSIVDTKHILCSSLQAKVTAEVCMIFPGKKLHQIEDDNFAGKEMLNALPKLPKVKTFQNLVSRVSEEKISILREIGFVLKDALSKYLDISREGMVTIVIAPAIFAIAYALSSLPDYWDMLDMNLYSGGVVFQQKQEILLLLQHL